MHLRTLQHRGFFGGEAREVGSGARRRCRAFRSSDSKEPGEGSSIGLDDWRAFRARLVSESDNDVGPWNSCLTAANFHILKDQASFHFLNYISNRKSNNGTNPNISPFSLL